MQRLLILTVFVQILDGLPLSDILDDDIVVPMAKSPDGQLFKVSLQDYLTSGLINRWPNNTVPYFIDPDSNFTSYHRALIEHMTTIFHRYTCIKFVPWTGDQDCCVVITDGKGSILHYSAFAFSKNETFLRTIDTLKPADIGQRYFLSHLDVTKIQNFYQCTVIDLEFNLLNLCYSSFRQKTGKFLEVGKKHKTRIIKEVKDASCTFDFDLCDWTQDYKLFLDDRQSLTLNDSFSDDFDFLKLNSSTLFTEFTPTKDHTTGYGHFLLAPSYDPRYAGDRARLRSPIYEPNDNSGLICIKFYYYMNPTQSNGMAGYLRMYVVASDAQKLGRMSNETKETLIWAANSVPLGGPMWHRAVKQIRLLGHNPIQPKVGGSSLSLEEVQLPPRRSTRSSKVGKVDQRVSVTQSSIKANKNLNHSFGPVGASLKVSLLEDNRRPTMKDNKLGKVDSSKSTDLKKAG